MNTTKILFVVLFAVLTAETSNAVPYPPLRRGVGFYDFAPVAFTSSLLANPTYPLIQPQLVQLNGTSFAVVELSDYDLYQISFFTNWTGRQVFTYPIPKGATYVRGPRTFLVTSAPNNSLIIFSDSSSDGYYTLVIDRQAQVVTSKFNKFVAGGPAVSTLGCRVNENMTVLAQGGGTLDLTFVDNAPSLISYNRYSDTRYMNTACDGINLYAVRQSQQTGLVSVMKFLPSNWTTPALMQNTTRFSSTTKLASITIVGDSVIVTVSEAGIMRVWQLTTDSLTEVLYKEFSDTDSTVRYPSFTSDGYFAFSQKNMTNGTWFESQMEFTGGNLVPRGVLDFWTSRAPFLRPNWRTANYPDLYGNGYISVANDMDLWKNRSFNNLNFYGDVCGDGIVSGTAEQCDGGKFCTAKCQCEEGYIPTNPRTVGCVLDTSFTNCTMCANNTQCDEQRGACVGYRVAPIFQCIEARAFGTKRAFFSYRSNHTATISGGTSNNKITPYGLPNQDFKLGRPFFYPFYAFYVDYPALVTTIEWYLDGSSISVDLSNSSSLLCPRTLSLLIEADTPSLTQMITFADKLRNVLAQAMYINPNFISITAPQSKKRQSSTMAFRADVSYDTYNGVEPTDAIQALFNHNVSIVFDQIPTVRSIDIMSVPSEIGEGVIAPDVQNSPIAWSPGAIVLPDPPIAPPVTSEPPVASAQPVPEPISSQGPVSSQVPASEIKPGENNPPVDSSGWSNSYIAIIVLVPAAVAVAIFLAVFFSRKKKRRMNSVHNNKLNRTQFNMPLTELRGEESNYGAVPDLSQPGTRESGKYGPITHIDGLNLTGDRLHVRYSELKFKEEIGAGAYGKVFIGEWQRIKVALKINTSATGDDFAREARLMVDLRPHPNVVQMLGVSSDGPYPVMILEFCDGGSLDDIVFNAEEPISVQQQLEMVLGIAKGLYHLHVNQIVHRDLAARNILMSHNTPKISDFGLSRQVGEQQKGTTKSTVGPIRWMAPESLKSMMYSTKSDVWSFGVVVSEVVSGQEPHTNEDQMAIGLRIRDQGFTPSIPSNCDPVLKQIMQQCWQRDPEARPTMEQICDILDQYMEERKGKDVNASTL